MQAVVIYESMFGNTRAIAFAIGTGLAEYFDVTVIAVGQAYPTSYNQADLIVVGGPTHVRGMSRPSTRQGAAKQAAESSGGLTLEPGALGEGLREWFSSRVTSRGHALAAAFDTRIRGPAVVTGRASKGISGALRCQDYELIAKPESFLVTKANELLPGEQNRARAWAASLAETLSLTPGSLESI
jgi:flavodoxin